MAIVYVDLESTLPSWYTTAVYAAGTTYAQNDYVIAAAASGLYSGTTAVLWKSLQNGNTGNALEEGAWWTVVADGSAAKPYKSIDDATRYAIASGNEIRVKKTTDPTALSGSYTFYDDGGSNTGKCIVAGNNPDALSVGDAIGTYENGFWEIYSITYSSPNTVILFGSATVAADGFASLDGNTNVTPATTYKVNYITLTASLTVNASGADRLNLMQILGGWDFSNPANPVRNGYTAIKSKTVSYSSKYFGRVTHFIFASDSDGVNVAYGNSYVEIDNCYYVNKSIYTYSGTFVHELVVSNVIITGADMISDMNGRGVLRLNNVKILRGGVFGISGTTIMLNCLNTRSRYYGPSINPGSRIYLKNCSILKTGINALFVTQDKCNNGLAVFDNCLTTVTSILNRGIQRIHNFNQVFGDHRTYYAEGSILSDSTIRHTASGLAWRYQPGALALADTPLDWVTDVTNNHPFEVAVAANSQVTATIWCKKSDADSAFEAQFICKGGQLAGIPNDVTAVATDSTDWQQLTIQVTPTETGVLRFGFQVWGSATATCHIDDFGVSQ